MEAAEANKKVQLLEEQEKALRAQVCGESIYPPVLCRNCLGLTGKHFSNLFLEIYIEQFHSNCLSRSRR